MAGGKGQRRRGSVCWGRPAPFLAILLSLLATTGAGVVGWAADEATGLTLPQFRAQVRIPSPLPRQREDPAAVAALRQRADAVFFDLLAAQGKKEAARQSLDRLSGWSKAAEARLAAQQVSPLDMELLRFAEAKAAARLARSEAEQRRWLQEASRLLGREPDSSWIVLTSRTAADQPAEPEKSKQPPLSSSTASSPGTSLSPNAASDFAKLQARLAKELLPQAYELLGKTYQSYLFGGVPLSELLWLEEKVYDAEWQHQSLAVEAEREAAAAGQPL
ncbi:MAG: hypothetical protein HYS38_03795 [Acidobacteria bacterium]|nr:hypothetical protein [Acidobacteriota bacterium]